MAEFHKMSAVISGLAHTFGMENKECEYLNIIIFQLLNSINLLIYYYPSCVLSLILFSFTDSNPLTEAIDYTAEVYKDIGTMHAQQVS